VEYIKYLVSMITNDARCTHEITSRTVKLKNNMLQEDSFHHQIGLKFKEETTKVMHLGQSFVGC